MSQKIVWSLIKYFFLLSVLAGLGACSAEEAPKIGEVSAKSIEQIEEFVQSQISRNWNKIAAAGETETIPLQMFVRFGPTSDPTICTTGELYGPFMVTNGSVEGEQSVEASQPTLRLSNLGDLSICMIITSPVNADLDIEADTLFWETDECTETPASIAGVWEGNFSCTSSCGGGVESDFVSLTILQDEYSATYTDGEASYEGTVCGNIFKYSGAALDDSYTERGTFTLNSNGSSASKTSSYQDTGGVCSGTCSDPELIRRQ